MTEEQHEEVVQTVTIIQNALNEVVNRSLAYAKLTTEQDELVRTLLTEQARFWK